MDEAFTDKVLNLMAGGFTILNGIFGVIYIYKHRENRTFGWKFRIFLTLLEFGMGIFFVAASDSIEVGSYMILGSITTVAGTIEVFHAITRKNLEDVVKDGKNMINAFKDKPNDEDGDGIIEKDEY